MRFGQVCVILLVLTPVWSADLTTRPTFSYSQAIGGSGSDVATAVATDTSGNVYIAGTTSSVDFPAVNAFQKRIGGTPFRASTDAGKTWTMPAIPDPVYAVAGSAKAPSVVYAGTARAIYKSPDSGKTWVSLPSAGSALVNALWVDPDTPSIVHAATSRGMMKSDDAGATWRTAPTAVGNVLVLAAHPSRPARLFAAMDIGAYPNRPSLYRTTDGGVTWTLLPNSPFGPFTLSCDAGNPDILYAGVSPAGFTFGSTTSVYKSTDGGDSWTQVSQPRLAIGTFAIASSSAGLFAATLDGLLRSSDGGVSWGATTITAPADSVTVDPTRGQTLYANADTGIFASTDSGGKWTSILPIRQLVEFIAVAPTTPPTLFVGAASGRNVFVTKFSGDGKQMLYSTYLGGSYYDYVTGIAVDRQGNAYVTGYAYSTDFPVTASAIQSRNAGNFNAFLAKIGPNGDNLAYSTYLGGSTADAAFGIALDSTANVYLTGYAGSSDFPVTPGAMQRRLLQNCPGAAQLKPVAGDAFVVKIATDGGGLRYATFLGGTCADEGIGIAVDSAGNAFVAGATTSPDFPVSKGAWQQTYPGSDVSGFVAKVSPDGSALGYATYLGGTASDSAFAIAVDAKGAAYVTGTSDGFDQPIYAARLGNTISTSPPPYYPVVGFSGTLGGAAFLVKLDPSGTSRQFLKYLGGTWGTGTSITLDALGNAWVAGRTIPRLSSDPFPTAHPFEAKMGGGFVSQIAADGSSLLFSTLIESAQQIALDPSGNAFLAGYTYSNPAKPTTPSAMLARIDGAVAAAMTLEEPQPIVPTADSLALGVAPGELVVLTGEGLGLIQEAGAIVGADGKLATSLSGTTLTFDGVPVPLLSVQARRIVGIVPFVVGTPGSTVKVQAQHNGSTSNSILLPIAWSAIEVLTAVNSDGTINSAAHPAAPGSVVTFYGAGFGQTNPSSAGKDGTINALSSSKFATGTVGATIADQDAQVLYAGPAPGQVAGVVQVNVRIPQLKPGSYPAVVGWAPVRSGGSLASGLWVSEPRASASGLAIPRPYF